MDYIKLGKSDLSVSQLGFGCWQMGGYGWGDVSQEEIVNSISIALDEGVNFFDTADVYGLGKAEELLGKVLKGQREKSIIATKFGVRFDNNKNVFYDNNPSWIEQALDNSLKRLDVNYIDLYQIHYKDNKTPIEDIFYSLEKNREIGKIRYYGISNFSLDSIPNFKLPDGLRSFQNEYSLTNRSNENLITEMMKKKLGFISYGSLSYGLLSGKYNINTVFPESDIRSRKDYIAFHGDNLKKNLNIVKEMKKISGVINKSLPQIAIRWILDFIGTGVVLTGIKNRSQLIDNIGAFGWKLNLSDIKFLDEVSRK